MKKYQTKVVVGTQWGDEGKGKIVDFLAQKADVVVRYQGGNNAGHSIVFDGQKYALKHLPSGIFNPKTLNVLGQGMVINPSMLIEEIQGLQKRNINNFQLVIADRAHVIMPYHLDLDAAIENLKQKQDVKKMIGTTKRGIGPCYEDKFARIGIRIADLINPLVLKEKIADALLLKNPVLQAYGLKTYEVETVFQEYQAYGVALAPYVVDAGLILEQALEKDQTVLFEGAQGVMLCIDNGSYPYVTSSSPTASGVALGVGLNHHYLNEIIGVVKAYTTRVGSGALPSEILDDQATNSLIRERGHEYGTVTGRPRRIGWLDLVILKHAIRVSGFNAIALTLLDVLDTLATIKICYAYELDGKEITHVPSSNFDYGRVKPKYLTIPGWEQDLTSIKSYDELPANAKAYLKLISDHLRVKIGWFSVGPDRKQTILID